MHVRAGVLAGLLMGIAAGPALAQSCGSPPIEPVIPSPADIGKKAPTAAEAAKHDAFVDIKNWQADLKNYRTCLTGMSDQAKRDLVGLDPQKDADKIKRLKEQAEGASHQYYQTVDSEERVVNEFHAIQVAYCQRSDVDKSSCPK